MVLGHDHAVRTAFILFILWGSQWWCHVGAVPYSGRRRIESIDKQDFAASDSSSARQTIRGIQGKGGRGREGEQSHIASTFREWFAVKDNSVENRLKEPRGSASDNARASFASNMLDAAGFIRRGLKKDVDRKVAFVSFKREENSLHAKDLRSEFGSSVEIKIADVAPVKAVQADACSGFGREVNVTVEFYFCDGVQVSRVTYEQTPNCTSELMNDTLVCVCPYDRTGFHCEFPRRTHCDLRLSSVHPECSVDDGELHYIFAGDCLVIGRNDVYSAEAQVNCYFEDVVDLLRGTPHEIPEDLWTSNTEPFPYVTLSADNSTGTVASVEFAISSSFVPRLQLKFINFFRMFSDSRGIVDIAMNETQLRGLQPVEFKSDVRILPTEFFAGGVPYGEVQFSIRSSDAADDAGPIHVSNIARINLYVQGWGRNDESFPSWAIVTITVVSGLVLVIVGVLVLRLFWKPKSLVFGYIDLVSTLPTLLFIRLAVFAGLLGADQLQEDVASAESEPVVEQPAVESLPTTPSAPTTPSDVDSHRSPTPPTDDDVHPSDGESVVSSGRSSYAVAPVGAVRHRNSTRSGSSDPKVPDERINSPLIVEVTEQGQF